MLAIPALPDLADFDRKTALTHGDVAVYNSTSRLWVPQGVQRVHSVNIADGTTVTNPGAGVATTLSLNSVLPAGHFGETGRAVRITFDGVVQGAATNNTRFRLLNSAAVLLDCTARANAGTTAAQVRIVWNLVCRSTGSSGTLLVSVAEFFQANAIFSQLTNLATVDLTAAMTLNPDFQPSVANANILCTPKQWMVEALN